MVQKSLILCLIASFLTFNSYTQEQQTQEIIEVIFPESTVASIPYEITIIEGDDYTGPLSISVNGKNKEVMLKNGKGKVEIMSEKNNPVTISAAGQTFSFTPNPIPLWWSILPPLIAIGLALIFREVVTSLFVGILFGAVVISTYSHGALGILYGLMHTISVYILAALSDSSHMSIILFSMLIGGTVAVISKNGGMQGIVDIISARARTPQSGQFATWLLGVVIFFDDYANTLVVGNTMRSVTDRLWISREKLSYIVDSTAAPVAAIAFVTTWIGAELGYIESGIANLETLNEGVYATFILSLQYSFYPIFTLAFILFLIIQNKDLGPPLHSRKHPLYLRVIYFYDV